MQMIASYFYSSQNKYKLLIRNKSVIYYNIFHTLCTARDMNKIAPVYRNKNGKKSYNACLFPVRQHKIFESARNEKRISRL